MCCLVTDLASRLLDGVRQLRSVSIGRSTPKAGWLVAPSNGRVKSLTADRESQLPYEAKEYLISLRQDIQKALQRDPFCDVTHQGGRIGDRKTLAWIPLVLVRPASRSLGPALRAVPHPIDQGADEGHRSYRLGRVTVPKRHQDVPVTRWNQRCYVCHPRCCLPFQ